jgi:hypothetical protein
MPPTHRVSRALLLFGAAMASSWAFTRFRGELGLTSVTFSRLHFILFWGASAVSTWWGSAAATLVVRWGARVAVGLAMAAALVPLGRFLTPAFALIAQDLPTLLWATFFSAALAAATAPWSTFFARGWWVLIGYRVVLHAAMWGDALSQWSLGLLYPLLTSVGQALMLILVAFSWLTLKFPETASEAP